MEDKFTATSGHSISGYTLNSIITYYIFMFIIGAVTNTEGIGVKIANDIKDGTLNNLIIRPISYIGYYFSEIVAQKLVQLLIVATLFVPVLVILASSISIGINTEQL